MPSAPSPTLSSGRPQRKSTATGVLAAGRKTGVAPQTTILKPEVTGNNSSRRNPARQSHVITPGANGTMRRDASDDRSKERRGLVNRSNGLAASVNKEVKSKSPRPSKGTLLPAPRLNEGRKSPRRMSPESASKPTQEESLMPPPRPVIRRRSPRRPSSPEPVSKSRPAPSTETRRLDAGQAKARSPVAETVSKPSTSAAAASTKRRSGVVKEVEKMQVIEFQT